MCKGSCGETVILRQSQSRIWVFVKTVLLRSLVFRLLGYSKVCAAGHATFMVWNAVFPLEARVSSERVIQDAWMLEKHLYHCAAQKFLTTCQGNSFLLRSFEHMLIIDSQMPQY